MEKFKSKMFRVSIVPFWKYKCDMFYFRKMKYIRGVSFRIFYIHFHIQERDALEKMIAIGRNMQKTKINVGVVER